MTADSVAEKKIKDEKEKTIFGINEELLGYKINYFLWAGVAAVYTFVSVIAKDRIGLSATAYGTILIARLFFSVLSKVFIGYVVDYFNNLKTVIILLIVVQWLSFLLILLVPPISNGTYNNCMRLLEFNKNTTHNISHVPLLWTEDKQNLTFFECQNLSDLSNKSNFSWDGLECYSDNMIIYLNKNPQNSYITIICAHKNESFKSICINKTAKTLHGRKIAIMSSSHVALNYYNSCYVSNSIDTMCDSISYIISECLQLSNKVQKYSNETSTARVPVAQVPINETFIAQVPINETFIAQVPINEALITQVSINEYTSYQFWTFGLLVTIFGICYNILVSLPDTACIECVDKLGADYGQQKLWAPLGWSLIASISGILIDYTQDYTASCGLFGITSILMIWNLSKLNMSKPQFPNYIFKNMGKIMKEKEFIFFEIGILWSGIGFGIISSYISWFVRTIGGSQVICGLVDGVQCLFGEVPFFFFASYIIKKLGYFHSLTLVLATYAFRFFWYSQLQNPWLLFPVEWMQGITYSVLIAEIASFSKKSSKPGTEATIQAIMFATYDSLGAGIGNILGGTGFDNLGSHQTYFYLAITFASLSIFSCILTISSHRKKCIFTVQ